jgi:hypothetical protein
MRLFVQSSAQVGLQAYAGSQQRPSAELWLREGAGLPGPPVFDEIEWVIEPGLPSFVMYRQRVTRSIRIVAACLGNSFDAIMRAMETQGSGVTMSRLDAELPSLATLIRAGQQSDLSQAGLMRLADPHRDSMKNWLVATTVGPELRVGAGAAPPGDADLREAILRAATMATVVVLQTLALAGSSEDLARLTEAAGDLHELGSRLDGFPPQGLPLSGVSGVIALLGARWRIAADH